MSVTAKSLLSKLAGPALDLVFLMSCAGCGKEGKLLCQTCVRPSSRNSRSHFATCVPPQASRPLPLVPGAATGI